MTAVQFNEDETYPMTSSQIQKTQSGSKGLINILMKSGVAKNETQAFYELCIAIVIIFALTLIIILFFWPETQMFTPEEVIRSTQIQ